MLKYATSSAAVTAMYFIAASPVFGKEDFAVGNWRGSSYFRKHDNRFSSCMASARYENGHLLSVFLDNKFRWMLSIGNPDWNGVSGKKIPLLLIFDYTKKAKVAAIAESPNLIILPMFGNSDVLRTFKSASSLDVVSRSQKISFKLDGTARLIDVMENCVRRNI